MDSTEFAIAEVMARHALWIHATGGSQPSKCACGHVFTLGELMSEHGARAVIEHLHSTGAEIVGGGELEELRAKAAAYDELLTSFSDEPYRKEYRRVFHNRAHLIGLKHLERGSGEK